MALANIAILLAQMGKKVLMIDWDLEAPGLPRYFADYKIESRGEEGLLDLLSAAKELTCVEDLDWQSYLSRIRLNDKDELFMISSGAPRKDYMSRVLNFEWERFFEEFDGGEVVEFLRNSWRKRFDFILIDSRTGITDSGGICTIQIPDILAIVFTANYQSLMGVKDVVLSAQEARQMLAFDRMPLLILPIPSRFDGRTEFEESQKWLKIFSDELRPFYADWLPKKAMPLQIIEKNKLPYVAYYSFGEKLPVMIEGTSDPESLGSAYLTNAMLLSSDLQGIAGFLRDENISINLRDDSKSSILNRQKSRSLSYSERLELVKSLDALPMPQLEQIFFALNLPFSIRSAISAHSPTGDKISELLNWVESPDGPGLSTVLDLLTAIVGDRSEPNSGESPVEERNIYLVPYPRNPFFTGREDILRKLREILVESERAALVGLGGIGKTQIAIEYSYRYQEDYEYIFWIWADREESILSSYAEIAEALLLSGRDQADQANAAQSVQRWLDVHHSWLLVFDNADDLRQVQAYLPKANTGHVLLTTRAQAVGSFAQRIVIPQMSSDEGAIFLLRRARLLLTDGTLNDASSNDLEAAYALTNEMGGLPVALNQAGAHVEEQLLLLTEYLDLFRTEKAELLQEQGQLDPYHPSVTVTVTLAFEKVAAASATAAALVQACAFLAPDAIPEEIFSEGAEAFGEPLSNLAESKLALTKAIAEAARFSLISRNPQTKTLTIHRLVQEVLRAAMDDNCQRQWAGQVVEAVTVVFPDAEFKNWGQCDRLITQAQTTADLIADYGLASETAALLLLRTGYYYDSQGRYGEAEPLYLEALAMRKQLLGEAHPDVATSLNNLAGLYASQGRYSDAEPLYLEALAMRKQLLGEAHPDIATNLNNLAGLYASQGRYSEAEPLYVQALELRRQVLGHDHPDVASTLFNLGALRFEQQRLEEAKALLLQALPIYQQKLGPDHPNTQNLLGWLNRVQAALDAVTAL